MIDHKETVLQEKKDRKTLKEKIERLKKGPLSCPFCREEFRGLSELFAHVKEHCR